MASDKTKALFAIAKLAVALVVGYGLAMIWMFTGSATYHATKKVENAANAWRKLDHIAIFFMIAGTYTPICYVYLDVYWRWSIIGAQWLLVLLGVFFKIFYMQGPRWLTVLIYVLMGWMVVIPLYQLLGTMPAISLWLLLAGGVAYTGGGLIYALKKPNPVPGFFGFHEIFHLLILIGAVLHYFIIYNAVTP